MAGSQISDTYINIVHQAEVDGGWSGRLEIVVGTNRADQDPLVFVDSDLLGPRRLVLTAEQANALSEALERAANELIPPHSWDLQAFESTFKHRAPAKHARTRADLLRHIRVLSDQHEAEKRQAVSR